MKNYKSLLLIATLLIVSIALLFSWSVQSKRTTEKFVGNLYFERYDQAAQMLLPPSSLEVDPEGGLLLTDRNGQKTNIPKLKLPFIVGGHDGGPEHDFQMMALGPSTNGILETPPVSLYLTVMGGQVAIEAVEVY